MKTIIRNVAFGLLGASVAAASVAGPAEDRAAFQKFYENRFPDTPVDDFKNGVYSILPAAREQWESIEEFPPYELAVERGERSTTRRSRMESRLRTVSVKTVRFVDSILIGTKSAAWL